MAHKDPLVAVLQLHLKPVAKPRQLDEARTWEGLGYEFADVGLLRQALSHGSSQKLQETYERLEFLGDRVLSLVIAEQLFKIHATEREGRLSARHSSLVRGEVCADIAEKLGVVGDGHVEHVCAKTRLGDVSTGKLLITKQRMQPTVSLRTHREVVN